MLNSAAEPPGTLSPVMTLYVVPSTLTLADRADGADVDVAVGFGVGVDVPVAPGVGSGMNGSLLVNLSSSGCSLAGSATASAPLPASEYTPEALTSGATLVVAPEASERLLATATARASAAPTISAITM